jgi:hypothetical protein
MYMVVAVLIVSLLGLCPAMGEAGTPGGTGAAGNAGGAGGAGNTGRAAPATAIAPHRGFSRTAARALEDRRGVRRSGRWRVESPDRTGTSSLSQNKGYVRDRYCWRIPINGISIS